MSRRNRFLLPLLFALPLGGCADYMNHRDSITLGAGNAVEANKGIHTIKPFPREAWKTDIPGDGERTYETMRRYEQRTGPPVGDPTGGSL